MKRLALLLACTASPAIAQDAAPRPSLAEVMQGATSMATVASGYLFVAKPDSAWICAININSNHFAALIAGDDVVVDQTVPGALCVPADHFKNLME
jgi:hypothetical protein